MNKTTSQIVILSAAFALTLSAAAQTSAAHVRDAGSETSSVTRAEAPDPLLIAMQQELAREKSLLVLPGMQRPYFMEYRLEDLHTYEAVANYGALTSETVICAISPRR